MTWRRFWTGDIDIITQALGTASLRYFPAVTGVLARDTGVTDPLTGSPTIRLDAAATAPNAQHNSLPASQTVGYITGIFRCSDVTPTADIDILLFGTVAGNDPSLKIMTTGILRMTNGGSTGQNGPTLANDTWYGIEIQFNVAANPWLAKWRTYDFATRAWTRQTDLSLANAAETLNTVSMRLSGVTSGTSINFAHLAFATGTTNDEHWSDTLPGFYYTKRYKPNADGTHSAFTSGDFESAGDVDLVNSSTVIWQNLDEDLHTTLTTYVEQQVAGAGKYFETHFADEAVETGPPKAVAFVGTFHANGTGANEVHVRASDDGATWTNLLGDWAAAGNDVSDTTRHDREVVMGTKPSGGAWTLAALNSLRTQSGNSDDVSAVPRYTVYSMLGLWPIEPSLLARPMGSKMVSRLPAMESAW